MKNEKAPFAAKQESKERLNKLKNDHLAHTVHELRTPLHSIIGMTDLVLKKPH